MASVFGHALTAIALGSGLKKSLLNWKLWTLGMVCSIIPDADVVGFKFGIAYTSFWGHRGFTHSLLFAIMLGILVVILFFRKDTSKTDKALLTLYFTISTASHSVLDAMTSGGLGVAFFSPWNNARYFLPWRPIKVSPIGVESFFSERGLQVIMNEAIWVGIPCILIILIASVVTGVIKK